jgi:hypothetical protein
MAHRATPLGDADDRGLTPAEFPVRLRLEPSGHAHLRASQVFRYVHNDETGEWRVRTRGYAYSALFEDDNREFRDFLSWHWHPGADQISTPHIHGHLDHPLWRAVHKLHIPSGRVSFESVLRFLITEVGVVARREDWSESLDRAEGLFNSYRTW